MLLRNPKNSALMIRIGMACLILFFIWPRFWNPMPHLSLDWVDGLRGVLLGIAIGLTLLAALLNGRRRFGGGAS